MKNFLLGCACGIFILGTVTVWQIYDDNRIPYNDEYVTRLMYDDTPHQMTHRDSILVDAIVKSHKKPLR